MYKDKLIQNKIVNTEESNIFANFLSSNSKELVSKVSRLDDLIGRDHWLSVGNYKESILRNLLSSTLPKKYEVSTGFIIASDREGKILKSNKNHRFKKLYNELKINAILNLIKKV